MEGHQTARGDSLKVFVVLDFSASFAKHLDGIREAQDKSFFLPLERLARVLLADELDFLGVLLLKTLEDSLEQAIESVHGLMVMVVDRHFEIQTRELSHVSVSVGVLSTEDGADLVHAAHVSSDAHLLGQLGRLCEKSGALEVVDLENGGARLGGSTLELGRVDLEEALAVQVVAEEVAHARSDAEDGLVGGGAQVEHPRVQAGWQLDADKLVVGLPKPNQLENISIRISKNYLHPQSQTQDAMRHPA